MKSIKIIVSFISLSFVVACGSSSSPKDDDIVDPVDVRSFKMGFTPWPYEATIESIDVTYDRIIEHGDLIKHHLQAGVPWQEAYDQTAYHPNVENEIESRLSRSPNSEQIYLAIDSLNTNRNQLADNWASSTNMERTGDWANRSFNSPEVIDAFIHFSKDMIDRFQPEYFDYGTEASELIVNDLDRYAEYLVFADAVYNELKESYPNLIILFSVVLKTPNSDDMILVKNNLNGLLPYTDMVGISTYPYAFFHHADRGDPENLPVNWLSQIESMVGDKPLAISETGWIAENLVIDEYQYSEQSDADKQDAYVAQLLSEANSMEMAFVIWYSITDFDALWENELAEDPLAKVWKDIGLYDELQQPRAALLTWDDWLLRPVQ